MIREQYEIRPISYWTAMNIVIEHHYLHRKCSCEYAFGLFAKDTGVICGVIIYGTPPSPPLRSGVCGEEESMNVIELARLWVSDSVPKNGESYLIANTIRKIDKEIIVSYADASVGHVGLVYQATNWIYTGLSAKRTDWKVAGNKLHSFTIAEGMTRESMEIRYGDDFYTQERPRKHRYIYFNCNKNRKKELLKKLRYPIHQYPKAYQSCIHIPTVNMESRQISIDCLDGM